MDVGWGQWISVNMLTWFSAAHSDTPTCERVDDQDTQRPVTIQSQLPVGWRMLSLWRWRCCSRIRLIRGWRDARTCSVDTNQIQTLSQHRMCTANRDSNNGTPRTPHLTISASAENNILSVWAELHMWDQVQLILDQRDGVCVSCSVVTVCAGGMLSLCC